jgi:sarcosine oxidase subunit beta
MSASIFTADVIIIGGGIHGCSTALHCRLRGMSVILIEKDHAGRHASGVNAGGVRQLARHLGEIPLSVHSMDIWHHIEELVDDECGFTNEGQILVAETQAEFDLYKERVLDLQAKGFVHEELIDAVELHRLVPAVAETCPGGVISRRDGAANPFRTTQAFRRKAEELGAIIRERERVTGLARDGAAWVVTTDKGRYHAPKIVNAAGAWADRIAAMLGEPVPLEVIAPMLMITARVPAFIKPVIILRGRTLSFKQFKNGTVLIGGGYRGWAQRDENTTALDWAKLGKNASTVFELFPIMRSTQIVRAWAGIEARMPDDIPVFGPSSTSEGVFHQFGFSAHGFQLGPGAGSVMSELVARGQTNVSIEQLRIERFADGSAAKSTEHFE